MEWGQITTSAFMLIVSAAVAWKLKLAKDAFDSKKETIYEALSVISSCYSKLKWTENGVELKTIRDQINDVDLTVKIRKVHEKLILSCSPSVVNSFLDCVVPKPTDNRAPTVVLNIFREMCLKDLRGGIPASRFLGRALSLTDAHDVSWLDKDRAFIAAFRTRASRKK